MRSVSEREFRNFVNGYKGKKSVSVNTNLDPPVVEYKDSRGKIIARYPEPMLGSEHSNKKMFYEVAEC